MTEQTPLEISLKGYQSEYNQLCGLIGHLKAQQNTMAEEQEEAEKRIKAILRKVKTLQANQPKKEEVIEEPKVEVSNGTAA